MLISCLLMLVLGWQIHLHFGANAMAGHLALYFLLVGVQFSLPAVLPVGEHWTGILSLAVIILCGLIVCWTIQPPNHPLFHDLSLADTFFRLPC
jgi:hypothetical protein